MQRKEREEKEQQEDSRRCKTPGTKEGKERMTVFLESSKKVILAILMALYMLNAPIKKVKGSVVSTCVESVAAHTDSDQNPEGETKREFKSMQVKESVVSALAESVAARTDGDKRNPDKEDNKVREELEVAFKEKVKRQGKGEGKGEGEEKEEETPRGKGKEEGK